MRPPRIEIIPARSAVRRDAATTMEVLVRIVPPLQEVHILRPPINLGIVLDRSGSMGEGRKMEQAREAAVFAVTQLLPTDRVSVTVFDDQIETIVPSTPVMDKAGIVNKIREVHPRGSTALHGGWLAGAHQVVEHVVFQGVNRVLLLSDGLANVGLTDTGAISGEVRGMAAREVGTSSIGVGSDYNEELLGAMARAGAGNYYHVQSSVQLRDIFQTELQGLMGTTGRNAELTIQPAPGVTVAEVLTELERGPNGQLRLSDLISEMPISVLIRLAIPPRSDSSEVARFRLAWDPTGEAGATPARLEAESSLALGGVPSANWEELPVDPAVEEQIALLMATRARDELRLALYKGDADTARAIVDHIQDILIHAPATPEVMADIENLQCTAGYLSEGRLSSSAKMAHYMAERRKQGRSSPPPQSS